MINLVPVEGIIRKIYVFRGVKVMLDADLAERYGVETKAFNQAVKRNQTRLPGDFMFQVSDEEFEALRSQFMTSNEGRGGRRYVPYVFTEQGVAMLSSPLCLFLECTPNDLLQLERESIGMTWRDVGEPRRGRPPKAKEGKPTIARPAGEQ